MGCSPARQSPTGAGGACVAGPGVSATSVDLGLLYPASGYLAGLFGAFRAGVEARIGVANADGGVHGRTIHLSWADDQSAEETNLTAARSLVEGHKVLAVLEETAVAAGSARYLDAEGVPVLGTPVEIAWTEHRNMFTYATYLSRGAPVDTIGRYAAQIRHGTKAAIVTTSSSDAATVATRKLTETMNAVGIQVVKPVEIATETPDYPALAEEIVRSGADVLTGVVSPEIFLRLAVYAKNAGAQLKAIVAPTGYDQAVIDSVGRLLPGFAVYINYMPFETALPGHARFLAAMSTYSPQQQPPDSEIALDGWIIADMFLRGLDAAGACPSRAGYIRALRGVHDYDAGGLLPEKTDFATNFGQVNRCLVFVEIAPSGDHWNVVQPVPLCGRRLKE